MRATAVMSAALLVFATAAAAQKPNFSGKWTIDQERTQAANPQQQGGGGGGGGRPGGMGGGMGGAFTLTLDATSLTRESEGPQGPVKTVFKLDGTETAIQMGPMSGKAVAKWDGNSIVIEQTVETQNGARTTKSVYTVEGDCLVITTTRQGRDGQPVTGKQFFKKG